MIQKVNLFWARVLSFQGLSLKIGPEKRVSPDCWPAGEEDSVVGTTHRPLSSSFVWFIFRTLKVIPNKELLRGLWVSDRFMSLVCVCVCV